MQQSVEELFEALSYEMAPVPCAGQELFRNEIKRCFGESSADVILPAVVSTEASQGTYHVCRWQAAGDDAHSEAHVR